MIIGERAVLLAEAVPHRRRGSATPVPRLAHEGGNCPLPRARLGVDALTTAQSQWPINPCRPLGSVRRFRGNVRASTMSLRK